MAEKMSFNSKYDIDGNYDPSESDDERSPDERKLLEKIRSQNDESSDEEEQLFAFSESEDGGRSDVADSDVEGKEASDGDIPDPKAWGKKKKAFYSTDYVDEDYGGFGKDEEAATLEEREARVLQQKLAEQLGDDDFSLDFFSAKKDDAKKDAESEIIVKSDLSQMSKRQKLQLLNKESPEFIGLVKDFKEKLAIAREILKPTLDLLKEGKLPHCDASAFVETYYELILNYCTNISFYLLLKAKKIPIQNHPVTKRLYQYRQMLNQVEPVYEKSVRSQLEKILLAAEYGEEIVFLTKKPERESKKNKSKSKKLKLLDSLTKNVASEDDDSDNVDDFSDGDESNSKGVTAEAQTESDEEDADMTNDFDTLSNVNPENTTTEGESEKRAITYQIAKNKGLTPKRKKEQRNPRVKHRNKYRKAIIRRKGAVREVRTELARYGGEFSGIKSNVVKSVKIK